MREKMAFGDREEIVGYIQQIERNHPEMLNNIVDSVENNVKLLSQLWDEIESAQIPSTQNVGYEIELKDNFVNKVTNTPIEKQATKAIDKLFRFRSDILSMKDLFERDGKERVIKEITEKLSQVSGVKLNLIKSAKFEFFAYGLALIISESDFDKIQPDAVGFYIEGFPYIFIKEGDNKNEALIHEKSHVLFSLFSTSESRRSLIHRLKRLKHVYDLSSSPSQQKLEREEKRLIEKSYLLSIKNEFLADCIGEGRVSTPEQKIKSDGGQVDSLVKKLASGQNGMVEFSNGLINLGSRIRVIADRFVKIAHSNNKLKEAYLTLALLPASRYEVYLPLLIQRWYGENQMVISKVSEFPTPNEIIDVCKHPNTKMNSREFSELTKHLTGDDFVNFAGYYQFFMAVEEEKVVSQEVILDNLSFPPFQKIADLVELSEKEISQKDKEEIISDWISPLLNSGREDLLNYIIDSLIYHFKDSLEDAIPNNLQWIFTVLRVSDWQERIDEVREVKND